MATLATPAVPRRKNSESAADEQRDEQKLDALTDAFFDMAEEQLAAMPAKQRKSVLDSVQATAEKIRARS